MKIDNDDRTTTNSSVAADNEKFFEELATAYVNQQGEGLKKEIPRAINLPTERLDGKVKQALKSSSKANQGRKRKNKAIVLSTMAAVFVMFLIYTAIIPTMNRQDAEWAADAPAEAAPEVAAGTPEGQEDTDDVMYVAEAEEAPADMEEEDLADVFDNDVVFSVVEEDVAAEPVEPPYFAGLFTSTAVVDQFEAALPEGYQIRERHFYDHSNRFHLISATQQPILLTEWPEETFGREIFRAADTMEVNGVEVLQRRLPGGEVQLDFQTMGSHFAITGLDTEELLVVARAVIGFPELSSDDGPGGDDIEVGVSEQIELIPLPRGLITIVPVK